MVAEIDLNDDEEAALDRVWAALDAEERAKPTAKGQARNAFCPTGEGGGVKDDCPPEHAALRSTVREGLEAAVHESHELTDSQKANFKAALGSVVGRMPLNALKRFRANLGEVRVHGSAARVSDAHRAETESGGNGGLGAGEEVAGYYSPRTKTLHLDGSGRGDPVLGDAPSLAAHEMMHVVDGPIGFLCRQQGWKDAWEAEMTRGQPSGYARRSAKEGLAEMGRLMYGGSHDLEDVKTRYPLCHAWMKSKGLWPTDGPAGKSVANAFDPNQPRDANGKFLKVGTGDPGGGAGGRTPGRRIKEMLDGDAAGDAAVARVLSYRDEVKDVHRQKDATMRQYHEMANAYENLVDDAAKKEYADAHVPEMRRLLDEANKFRDQGDGMKQAALVEALGVGQPAKVTYGFSDRWKDLNEHQQSRVKDAAAWLNGKVDPRVMGHFVSIRAVPIPDGKAQRDNYTDNDGGTLNLSKWTSTATVVHEFGHHINARPEVGQLTAAFHQHRFGDEPPTRMRDVCKRCGYEAHEEGRKDRMDQLFDEEHHAYYTGKTYSDGQTELVSMGLEKMYRDPVGMAEKDPEFFKFMRHVLRGGRMPK